MKSQQKKETAVLARELSQVKAEKILFIFGPEGGISQKKLAFVCSRKGGLKIGLGRVSCVQRQHTALCFIKRQLCFELLKQSEIFLALVLF